MVNPAYYGPIPQPIQRPRQPWTHYLPLIVAVIAVIGLAGTLLPMWSLTLQPGDFGFNRYEFDVDSGSVSAQSVGGLVSVSIGFYDWFISAAPVAAVMPIVFALTIALATAQWLSGSGRHLWGAASALSLCSIIVVAATALRPEARHTVTGPLVHALKSNDLAALNQPTPMDVSIGAGFIVSLVALLAIGTLTGWYYYSNASRPPAQTP